jgi:gliding motility-associated-like protein
MKLTSLFVFLLLFCSVRALPQDIDQIFRAKESFAETENTVMTKVIVCAEDQSVWALSAVGEVYYKLSTEAAFTKYIPSNGMQVADLAGYNANEMYFLAEGKLYESKNSGTVSEIPLLVPSQINNIAVVNASRNVYLQGYLPGNRDWLAVATNSRIEVLHRDNGLFGLAFTPISNGSVPECRITNGGFKSLDFQYKYLPGSQCFGPVEHTYFNKVGSADTETILPDEDPLYSGRVNCTYFEAPFNLVKDGNAGYDYWGTDQGLFVKTSRGCGLSTVRKPLNVKINDLEELNFFRDFFNDKIMLAAAGDGLYYTTRGLFPEGTAELDKIGFSKLHDLDFSVNGIAIEVNGLETEGKFICQSAVWLATAKGIVKIPMRPASKSIAKDVVGRHGELVSVSPGGLRPYYCVSNGEEYTFTANLPDNNAGNYTIQWLWHRQNYFERAELPGTAGMNPMVFNSGGEYGARITSPCMETIDIGGFWLRDPDPVTVDFNYDDVETMLEGCTFTFRAKAGNQYKWEKDGLPLRETSNVYVATEPGLYQLFYNDAGCSGKDVALPPVRLVERSVPDPVITRSSNLSLCYGEKVTLTVNDPEIDGVTYKWQRNGNPISDAVSREYEAALPGNYDVTLIFGECSVKRSATAVVVINEELKLAPPPEVQICTIRAQRIKLAAPEGFAKYTWDGAEGTANFLEVTETGQYTLDVEDASGCKASALYVVVPYCPPPVPPNVFSPNGDGINDLWTVSGLEDDPNAKIHIYNRFGVSVFDGSAKQASWNGKLRGTDVPDGTYYYVVIKSSAKPTTGSLVLIR